MLKDLVLKNRSYRRFEEDFEITEDTVRELISHARVTPSAANRQFFKFRISTDKAECEKVFSSVVWAAYLNDGAPKEGERPRAYITILNDNRLGKGSPIDIGIMAQTILLAATEKSLGGCMMASFKAEPLKEALGIGDDFDIALVIALGKPCETVVLEDMKDGDVKYWRDENGVHHVPKRSLNELII